MHRVASVLLLNLWSTLLEKLDTGSNGSSQLNRPMLSYAKLVVVGIFKSDVFFTPATCNQCNATLLYFANVACMYCLCSTLFSTTFLRYHELHCSGLSFSIPEMIMCSSQRPERYKFSIKPVHFLAHSYMEISTLCMPSCFNYDDH